ncbi:MAG: DUF2461 domain-containing protein [Saprospiraceae bacterium]
MSKQTFIPAATLTFLRQLKKNNNREWFQENKNRYDNALVSIKAFRDAYQAEMEKTDEIEDSKIFRIYRDVRFSKDKSPYKGHFRGYLRRASKARRGSYYFNFQPGGNSMIGGGFYNPNSADLKLIRDHIAADDKPLRKIIKNATFKKYFGTLQGEQVKTAPKGFDKEHPAIDLLRYKQFYVFRNFKDKEISDPGFLKEAVKTSKSYRAFFDYMSEILTTNLNGESLL